MDIFLLKIFQTIRIKMNQIEGFDGLDIGKCLWFEAVEPGTHGTFLVIAASAYSGLNINAPEWSLIRQKVRRSDHNRERWPEN